jgi:phosphoglycerate dehydrogenase-like enzyme
VKKEMKSKSGGKNRKTKNRKTKNHGSRITDHASRHMSHMKDKTVPVVGLGYVGLPLADAFSKHLNVIGFDIDEEKRTN